jgi:hypothetical protein
VVGVERDVVGALALIAKFAVERVRRSVDSCIDRDLQLQPDGETYAEDVETRTWSA